MTSAPAADRFRSALASPLPGVPAAPWARFLAALELRDLPGGRTDIRPIRHVSESGGLGSYDLRPRRLVELGLGRRLRYERGPEGRCVYACDFVAPLTRDKFLSNPVTQYQALVRSMVLYHAALTGGEIARPDGVSLAGALAILHRGGRGALARHADLFTDTRALFERARGAF